METILSSLAIVALVIMVLVSFGAMAALMIAIIINAYEGSDI